MKPYTADELLELTNLVFRDHDRLAYLNALTDIVSGRMTTETLAGDPSIAGKDDYRPADIAAIGLVDLPQQISVQFRINRSQWADGSGCVLSRSLIDMIDAFPDPVVDELEEIVALNAAGVRTVVGLSAGCTEGGAELYQLHRHPAVDRARAIGYIKRHAALYRERREHRN